MTFEERKLETEKFRQQMLFGLEQRAKRQALLNDPELQHQRAEQEAQKRTRQMELQSEQLLKRHAEQTAEVNKLLASIPGGKPITKMNKVTTSEPVKPELSNDEQYKQTIVTSMVALIKQRKMK